MLWNFVDSVVHAVGSLGYTGIFIMMTIESSFIPFPSEVAMIPAGYLASTGEMNFIIAFIAWTLGALTGSIINYVLWLKLGGPIIQGLIHRFGKYILLKEDHYHQAEVYFQKHWSITTFLWRFIPAIRQLISLPAWVFHMNFAKFCFYTALWAGIWNLILMSLGYVAGENKDLIEKYSNEILAITLLFVIIVWWTYYLKNKRCQKS